MTLFFERNGKVLYDWNDVDEGDEGQFGDIVCRGKVTIVQTLVKYLSSKT